jgi:hypothetical protein
MDNKKKGNRMEKVKNISSLKKTNELFLNRFSTILLVQSKLLPSSVLGIKDPADRL